MKKILEWFSKNEWHEPLKPAKLAVPEWYKKIPLAEDGSRKFKLDPINGHKTHTLKACVPFLDAMTHGYVIHLQQDVQVSLVNDVPVISWAVSPAPIEQRAVSHLPMPESFYSTEFVWLMNEAMRVPKGYSLLITHPLNRYDLPFMTLSGVVDADSIMNEGRIPWYLRKGFEGVIEKGTPIMQVIPFRRESWTRLHNPALGPIADKSDYDSKRVISGFYKKHHWFPKTFD